MTSRDFVIWLKGFTEACNDYTATPKQWDRIKEVLEDVEDYDDNPGIDEEIDDWYLPSHEYKTPLTGSINISFAPNGTDANSVWNDQMGCWYCTNYPEGFGYYTNSTAECKNKKQQLND